MNFFEWWLLIGLVATVSSLIFEPPDAGLNDGGMINPVLWFFIYATINTLQGGLALAMFIMDVSENGLTNPIQRWHNKRKQGGKR